MLNRLQNNFNYQIILIAVICIIAFGNTLKHGFVLDDKSAIEENTFVNQGISGISDIWSHSYMYGYSRQNDETYRPIPTTFFAIEHQLFGDNSTTFHFLQILLYLFLCVLILFYLKRLLRDYHPLYPLLITLIFCVHPIHTEVVANIKSADEILALLFGIAALHLSLLSIDKEKKIYIIYAVLTYFLAVVSKENAVTLLVIFPLQLWFFRSISLRKNLIFNAAFLLPLLSYFILRFEILDNMTFEEGTYKLQIYNNSLLGASSVSEFTGTAFIILKYYLKLIFVPTNLSYDYSFNVFPIQPITSLNAMLSVVIYLAFGAIALIGTIKKWSFSFGLVFFLAVISIYSNLFVKIGSSCGERFLFTPLLGFILFLVLSIDFIQKKKNVTWLNTRVVSVFVMVIILSFTSMTFNRNKEWKNEETLFLKDVKTVPNSFRTNLFAADIYKAKAEKSSNPNAKNNLYKKGLKHLKAIYKIYPEYDGTYFQMAQIYRDMGEWNKMKTVVKAGLKYHKKDLLFVSLLANAHLNLNEFEDARKNYLLLDKSGDSSYVYSSKFNVGASYFNEQKFDSAIVWFKKAITVTPKDVASSYYLGICYFQVGNFEKAIQYFSRVPSSYETYAHSQSSIGTIYLIEENYDKALVHLNTALMIVPGDENILNNMIVAYQELGDLEKAKECAAMINSSNAAPDLQ